MGQATRVDVQWPDVLCGCAVALLPLAAEANEGAKPKKLKNPAQDSLKRGGSSTAASMSSFDMEGACLTHP